MSEPQPQEQVNHPQPEPQAERQRQVEALADEYLERLLEGETPDRQAFLAAHPELADLLGPRLELVELMHRVAHGQQPAAGKSANAAPGERVLRVKCPHCGNGIQLVEPESTEVTCSGCGSSFHVEPGATTSFHSASSPRSIGRFEILEQLGRGAFGIVYKARDPQLQRLVAVKVPRAGSFATPEEEERFLREARAAAQLNHPGIVPVLEIAHDRNVRYIVSGYIEGLTLADMLTARRPSFRETAELIAAVADALDFAHRQKTVHRDIKPSNLLLDDAGRPHITDFGLARRGEPEITVTLDGQILGTPAYMSPEQAAGDQQHVDARSDVYSLGVVLYELLTGELPFRGNQRMLLHQVIHDEPRPPRSLNDRVPRDLETICLKAMAKTPARRYASAREMADDLRRFLNGEAIRARRVGRAEKMVRWARRNPAVAGLAAAVAFLLVTVTVGAVSFALYLKKENRVLTDEKEKVEQNAEVRAASAVIDADLKFCEAGEVETGVLRLARTLRSLPPHATELRQCVEMNLLAWSQELGKLGPTFLHDGAETMWELSPDGLTVLTGGADGTARLWDSFTGEVRATLRGHRGKIDSIAFSKNGRVAMTVGEDRTVRLWDTNNGQLRAATIAQTPAIDKALLSPNGARLLTVCQKKSPSTPDWPPLALDLKDKATLTLWNTATGKQISELQGHTGHVNDAVFCPDGQTLLTGGADRTARLWSVDTGRALTNLQEATGAVLNVAFSSDGKTAAILIYGNGPYHIHWWDPNRSVQIAPATRAEGGDRYFRFISHDVVAAGTSNPGGPVDKTYILGMPVGFDLGSGSGTMASWATDNVLFDTEGRSYDRNSGQPLTLLPSRKYHADLARFAIDGRFLVRADRLVDLLTGKAIGKSGEMSSALYVSDRQTFVSLKASSARYVPLFVSPLDVEVAQLFAEVVTCRQLDSAGAFHLLKESEWEERRRKLLSRLDEHPAPPIIGRLAADRWHWLRRQEDRARPAGAPATEEELKYLDRLIAEEPNWQNYHRRAERRFSLHRWVDAAQDCLEAGMLAGEGYWHGKSLPLDPGLSLPFNADMIVTDLILSGMGPEKTREEYQWGLRLAEKVSTAMPENQDRRVLVAIALYRLGRYNDAILSLEPLLRERDRAIISQMGRYFLLAPWPAPLFEERQVTLTYSVRAIAFWAMAHQRLGHPDLARAALVDLRRMVNPEDDYEHLIPEAETLIEGKPRPDE